MFEVLLEQRKPGESGKSGWGDGGTGAKKSPTTKIPQYFGKINVPYTFIYLFIFFNIRTQLFV